MFSFEKLLKLSAVATVVSAAVSGCGQASGNETAPAQNIPVVTVEKAMPIELAEKQEFSGRIEAVDNVEIRPRVSGFISTVNFKAGSLVKKGDLLFTIDSRPYMAEVKRTEADAKAARARADLAKIELARAVKLVADKAIAQREADTNAANFKALDAAANSAQAAYDAAKLNLSFTNVISPITGRVSKAEVTPGNLVNSNVNLTSVVSNNPVYVSFDGDENTFLQINSKPESRSGITVNIGLANENNYPHHGKLDFIDNNLNPATGSVRMRAVVNNADGILAPGLFSKVQLVNEHSKTTAFIIPDKAIGTDQSHKYVFVVNDKNKIEYRTVTLGNISESGRRIIKSGITTGDNVVINGMQKIRAGMDVSIAEETQNLALNSKN